MKYTPKEIEGNVNVSEQRPLREFFVLLAGVFGACFAVYLLLGFAMNWAVLHLPPEVEVRLGKMFLDKYIAAPPTPQEGKIQEMVDRLKSGTALEHQTFHVHVVEEFDVNAMALPGNHIVIFSGLLQSVESENELAMVLGHELGHFANRDHLRGLGRGLVLVVVSAAVLSVSSPTTDFVQTSLVAVNMKFSQKQEQDADAFGLDVLRWRYGHAGGATDFFKRLKKRQHLPEFAEFFSTHPSSDDRVSVLDRLIASSGMRVDSVAALDTAIRNKVRFSPEVTGDQIRVVKEGG